MSDDVVNLLHNDKWNNILKLIKNKKLSPIKKILNNNSILHLAGIHNKKDVVKYIINTFNENTIFNVNGEGNNICHILAYYGNITLLTYVISKHPKSFNKINMMGNTPLYYLMENHNVFKNIISDTNVNLDNVNNKYETLLTLNIKKFTIKNDVFFKNIKFLLDKGVNINIPPENKPIDIVIYKNDKILFDLLLDYDIDLVEKNSSHITPLINAVNYDRKYMAAKILEKDDNNYEGPQGDHNTISLSMLNNNFELLKLLLDKTTDLNKFNRYMETPAHIVFSNSISIPNDLKFRTLYNSDLNIQNIEGATPLHYLFKTNEWINYTEILKTKKLDLFIKDNNDIMPINYVKDKNFSYLMDIVLESYNNKLSKTCSLKNSKCKTHILNSIIESRKSYVDDENNIDVELVTGENSIIGKFNSDTLHNIIYTLYFLNKHKNVSVPHKYTIGNKITSENIELETNLYSTKSENIIYGLVNTYRSLIYSLSPYVIIWKDEHSYYIDKYLKLYIIKLLNAKNIRYIHIKLTLISSSSGTHANTLFFDKKTCSIERFDPYGNIPYLNVDKLDDILENYFKDCFSVYCRKNKLTFTYLRPSDFMDNVSFQIISNDEEEYVKKLGDPAGYCLAWTFWYMETRIKNSNVHPKELIKNAIKKIVNKNNNDEFTFIDFIRNYASDLDKNKNKFLLKCGIDDNNIYNMYQTEDDEKQIIKCISLHFSRLMSERH